MKTIAGIALGFALTPAVIGLMGLFVWTSLRFGLEKSDTALGVALGICSLMLIAAITLWRS